MAAEQNCHSVDRKLELLYPTDIGIPFTMTTTKVRKNFTDPIMIGMQPINSIHPCWL